MKTQAVQKMRIHARVSQRMHATMCRAAELTGMTVDQFMLHAALKEAQLVIERDAVIRLSPRDWNWLLALTEFPTKPNKRLQTALRRYRRQVPGKISLCSNKEPSSPSPMPSA